MQISGETVVATSGKEDWDFVALPGTSTTWVPKWGFLTSAPTFDPRFDIGGQLGGWHYGVKAYGGYGGEVGSDGEAKRGPAVNEYCDFAGVFGTGIYVTGVAGTSVNNIGVYGQAGDPPPVLSTDLTVTAGVFGLSNDRPGVLGISSYAPAAVGVSFLNTGVTGVSGVPGPQVPNTIDHLAGVLGTSGYYLGVLGTSSNEAGVAGYSANAVGVYGESGGTGPNAYAGFFRGNLRVTGAIQAGTKDAIVPFPDGSHRLLHCMESPEHWFEDFGTAKLKRGRAVVKLDADFAKTIKTGDYRVFLTPKGDCGGLYIKSKRGGEFEVRELAGGKSSVAFSYRIVGRRKDIKGHKRFPKIDTSLSPAAATRAARKRAPTAAEFRKFAAQLEKLGARKGRRPRALPKGMSRSRFMRRLAKT